MDLEVCVKSVQLVIRFGTLGTGGSWARCDSSGLIFDYLPANIICSHLDLKQTLSDACIYIHSQKLKASDNAKKTTNIFDRLSYFFMTEKKLFFTNANTPFLPFHEVD